MKNINEVGIMATTKPFVQMFQYSDVISGKCSFFSNPYKFGSFSAAVVAFEKNMQVFTNV